MATDDGAETRLAWIKIDIIYIVQDIDQEIAKLDDLRLGKVTGPFTPVNIPPHGDDRSDRSQSYNHLGPSYVPGMDQKVCPLKGL